MGFFVFAGFVSDMQDAREYATYADILEHVGYVYHERMDCLGEILCYCFVAEHVFTLLVCFNFTKKKMMCIDVNSSSLWRGRVRHRLKRCLSTVCINMFDMFTPTYPT